jgi:hypothetical protein
VAAEPRVKHPAGENPQQGESLRSRPRNHPNTRKDGAHWGPRKARTRPELQDELPRVRGYSSLKWARSSKGAPSMG